MIAKQHTTIDLDESAHFGALAADWWDPDGQSAMLHTLNPVRLGFVRRAIDAHWGGDGRTLRPLVGKSVLDVGCGAGLMCEPLARLGGSVTGVDAAPENVAVASEHAAAQGLSIDYRAVDVVDLEGQFDLVTSMEVIEHVADPAAFVSALAARLAPEGLMILSTPNRTPLSRLAMIQIGEGLGRIPKGTHHWDQFLTPDELAGLCADSGLHIIDRSGLAWNPAKQFHLSADEQLNYLFALVRSS
jgi:2-polyprenyl-6-hydroxyphenyl methylase / 3-demethylubiquinone-9 3-methyltransferase